MRAFLVATILGTLGISATAFAGEAGSERFEKKVRPLLAERCWRCHGAEQAKGGLRLDTADALLAGGESGPAVVPGKPDESPLIAAVRYSDGLKMPPKGKLSDAEVLELTEWVRAGAIWPGGASAPASPSPEPTKKAGPPSLEDGKSFWAFQPPRDPSPPAVRDAAWVRSPIDRFILAALEEKGLAPAPEADKRSLIRRATFDLTGLPPTPEEVEAFLADQGPDAFARVVDRLLASSRYGERWGRHWLDLARFADSNGMDENVAYANAFRYRDYVIRAFNADTPYTQFIREQLAGDLLPRSEDEAANRNRMIATGFLVLGPKMLAEDDPLKMEMDIIDEQVDTVGKVFMGLTLGCARCHDHKFDPIPTADYYSLAGIFKSTKSMFNHTVVAMWNERSLATADERAALDAHRKEVARRNDEIKARVEAAKAEVVRELRTRLADYLPAAWQIEQVNRLQQPPLAESKAGQPGTLIREAESFDKGNVLVDTTGHGLGIGVILNKGEVPNFAEYNFDIPAAGVYQLELRYASAEPRPVRLVVNGLLRPAMAAGSVTGSFGPEKQAWTVEGVWPLKAGRNTIRVERDGAIPHINKLALVALPLPDGLNAEGLKSAEEWSRDARLNLRLLERWRGVLARAGAEAGSIFRAWNSGQTIADVSLQAAIIQQPRPQTPLELALRYQQLVDKALSGDPAKLEPAPAALRRVIDAPDGPFAPLKEPETDFAPEMADLLRRNREELVALEAKPPFDPRAMAVEEQKATNLRVHIRGNHMTLGDETPRQFLRVIAGESQSPIDGSRSGRLELADWLASPDHPLTARVMVNRLWLWHFGEAIVRSPDNFGQLGDRPAHLDLLDWLSRRFVESGWSVKTMHRAIMLSATYRMGTRHDAKAALADPENRLHWRMNRRRLEAEAIRDALLFVGGQLDPTMGGTLVTYKSHQYVSPTGGPTQAAYERDRRSVYLPVIRSALYDVFQALDFADPSSSNGQRVSTTVAPQALFMMNDRIVLRASEALAKELQGRSDLDEPGRIRLAYAKAFGRPPTDKEIARVQAYLRRFEAELESQGVALGDRPAKAWQAACQSLLSASEFIYLN